MNTSRRGGILRAILTALLITGGGFLIFNSISCDLASPTALPFNPSTASTPTAPSTPLQGGPLTISAIAGVSSAGPSNETISESYSWSYKGNWTWKLEIPRSLYDYFRNLPRPPTKNYSVYVTHPLDDAYIDKLVSKFISAAKDAGLGKYQTVEMACAFVQSLPYTSDSVTTPFDEYPRYPVETLVDNGGDCEDTSILLASILREMDYDTVLINLPNHMAVGVAGDDSIYGTYWNYNGRKYFYIETTGENWKIGELPDKYRHESAHIYELIPAAILTHDWKLTMTGGQNKINTATLTVDVNNVGTAAAPDVFVFAGFDAGGEKMWNPEKSQTFSLAPGQSIELNLNLRVPMNTYTRLLVQISQNGYTVDESYSKWIQTP